MAGYPHGKFNYKVEIDGLEAGGFSEVTGFDASIDVIEYREGDMTQTPLKIPGTEKIWKYHSETGACRLHGTL